ncbi:B3 domain-containing protein Os01g0905400-like [Momordica charantia]|uniref:B3 domain-containing protein Os01g0905400-like n=1 Tax=Momordica charantia TaxID=3673 RepID=A0A6J1C7A5_MOMCH|nr:B3 domain-containing protein Os01g0905400-like [Momordica charantia]XP_022137100.1 B3 domain-containing protein Os01g0905400-like [Momordica charantia]XP_022137101.1 B3 domain-containing protein Os01g0905400-like [Momordica charantia]XP_022137102.1 B3 domain-containing protein Os01g0905400-like [Momordica charantia]
MGSKVEACMDCTQRCLQLHRKANSLSSVTSFFKVMFGDLFSQALYFPPMFAATVPMLANKKVVLEDSLGQQWKVTVSDCEGSLAFKKGWSAFSSEHSLEIGDFVIFNHIMDLHFKVSIYTKTGCEKVEFAKRGNMRKRTRSTYPVLEKTNEGLKNPQASGTSVGSGSNVALSQDKCNMTSSQNVNVNRDKRPKYQSHDECHKPLCKTEIFDDSYNFINQNKDVGLEENRSPLVDLFSMEIPGTENATNKVAVDELNPNCASTLQKATIDVHPVVNAEVLPFPLNISANEIIEKSQCFEEADRNISGSDNDSCHDKTIEVPFVTSATNSDRNMEHFCDTPLKDVVDCQNVPPIYCTPSTITRHDQEPHQKHTFPTDYSHSAKHEYTPISVEVQNFLHGDMPKIVKQEPLEIITEVDKHEDLIKQIWEPKFIKEEFLEKSNKIGRDGNDVTNNAIPAHISCIVAKDTPSFLELPTSLQLSCSRGRRNPEKKRLVFLRDPRKRLWPMLYHEMPNVQVLTSGWEAFCSVNQIEPGDECLFHLEDEPERIYQVSIRKCKN